MNARKKLTVTRMRRAARVRARIRGTAEMPRLTVFRSNRSFYAQLIDDAKGHTLASVSVATLKKEKLSKSQAAEKIGAELAEKAGKLGVKRAVFDRGRYPYHGRVKAFAESAKKSGLTI